MSSPNSSTSPTTYSGSCHCNQISYTVTLPAALAPQGTEEINSCNCSICTKNGYLLVYPLRSDVQFLNHSDEKLKSYYFGQKEKPHKFCPECGSSVLIDFGASPHEKESQFLAMNVSEVLNGVMLYRGGDS